MFAAVRLRVAAALAAIMCAAGCSGTASTSGGDPSNDTPASTTQPTTAAPTTRALPPPPDTGECRQLTFGDIRRYSNAMVTTDCSEQHTAYTFAVEELPADVAFEGVPLENDAVQDAAAEACNFGFVDFIGGTTETRSLSRLTVTYFLAQQQAFDRGAHWVRCDVVALQSADSLAPLPEDLEGYLDSDRALQDYGVCSRGEPGAADSVLVMCSQLHDYRAVTALRLGENDEPYPGEAKARSVGGKQCKDFVGDLLGVSGGFTYGWTFPSAADWLDGQRFGYCWNESED